MATKKTKAVKAVKAVDITGGERNTFLTDHLNGKVKGAELLTALRACKKVDGRGGMKMKVFALLTGQIKTSHPFKAEGKVVWDRTGKDKDEGRGKSQVIMGLSEAIYAELKPLKASEYNG